MRKIFILTCLLIVNNIIAQTSYERQLKYWYLRDRLRHFIIKSDDPLNDYGSYLVVTSRNRNYKDNYDFTKRADYGQEMRLFGKYLGMLATEFYLLERNNQYSDADKANNELLMALNAIDRLDLCETNLSPPTQSTSPDGFFIRHDVPQDDESSSNAFIVESEINLDMGILLPEDPLLSAHNSIREVTFVEGMTPINEYMSLDEAVFLLEGLSLAYKFGSDDVKSTARSHASNILNRLYGWYNGVQFATWVIYDPYGNIVPDAVGGDCRLVSFGLAKLATDFFGLTGFVPVGGAEAIWAGLHNGTTGYNARIVATIAAIGKGWGPDTWPFRPTSYGIYNNTDQDGWDYYYLWLYKALWDQDWSIYNVDRIEDRLDEAPCVGPYFESLENNGGNGWCTPDRWSFYQSEKFPTAIGDNADVGIYSGLDYMILHNLYYINYDGDLSDFINYISYQQSTSWPIGGETGTVGSIVSPFSVLRFRSVESCDKLFSYQSNAADIAYQAGVNIKFLPGFKCEKGARLKAIIHDLDYCTNKRIRNNVPTQYPEINSPSISYVGYSNELVNDEAANINVFPNPSSGVFTVDHLSGYTGYTVFKISGEKVITGDIDGNTLVINLSNEQSGIYILVLHSPYSVIQLKLSLF